VDNEKLVDMEIIKQIESSGDPKAFNKVTKCRGLYQVSEVCAKDYITFHPDVWLTKEDLFNPTINTLVAYWYMFSRLPGMLEHYKMPVTVQMLLIAYNWGIGNAKKWYFSEGKISLPEETRGYVEKYNRMKETK